MQTARRFRKNYGAMLGLVVLLALVVGALGAPWLSPYDPNEPGPDRLAPPSPQHPLGTDPLGRDVLSRLLYGGRVSLQVGIFAVAMAVAVGTVLGLVAAYFEGWVDHVIMRVMDFLLAFPGMLLAIALIGALGPSMFNVMLALGISSVPSYTRVVRGTALSVKQNEYVQAAQAVGGGAGWILVRHVAPNVAAPIIVMGTLGVAGAILATAGLSFIGLGPPPPTPEWGAMLAMARSYLRRAWWLVTFPGLAITLAVLAINLVGDGLRDALDPRLKT